jgi:ABC-type branched-subunit amino acid transport system substrate-binding protein
MRIGNPQLASPVAAALVLAASPAAAETIKIGVISTDSGLNTGQGECMERGLRLYQQQHERTAAGGGNRESGAG